MAKHRKKTVAKWKVLAFNIAVVFCIASCHSDPDDNTKTVPRQTPNGQVINCIVQADTTVQISTKGQWCPERFDQ